MSTSIGKGGDGPVVVGGGGAMAAREKGKELLEDDLGGNVCCEQKYEVSTEQLQGKMLTEQLQEESLIGLLHEPCDSNSTKGCK